MLGFTPYPCSLLANDFSTPPPLFIYALQLIKKPAGLLFLGCLQVKRKKIFPNSSFFLFLLPAPLFCFAYEFTPSRQMSGDENINFCGLVSTSNSEKRCQCALKACTSENPNHWRLKPIHLQQTDPHAEEAWVRVQGMVAAWQGKERITGE